MGRSRQERRSPGYLTDKPFLIETLGVEGFNRFRLVFPNEDERSDVLANLFL
jgi:hypothetical protein